MKLILLLIASFLPISTNQAFSIELGYNFVLTTAYSVGDPFKNQIDTNFIEPDTGFFQVANLGSSTFSGVIGTIAVSSFAGDLSWKSSPLVLAPGASVSVGIPDDSSAVGGFNGPYYFYRPGVEITLQGIVSNETGTEPVDLLVADRDIHSGHVRSDPFSLLSDSFVLQGGDPWGFNNGNDYALSQAYGVDVLSQPVPEPGIAAAAAILAHAWRVPLHEFAPSVHEPRTVRLQQADVTSDRTTHISRGMTSSVTSSMWRNRRNATATPAHSPVSPR